MFYTRLFSAFLFASFLVTPFLAAEDPPEKEKSEEEEVFQEIKVKERSDDLVGISQSATEGATGKEDLKLRPILRPGELMETVPGLIVTQHSGDGKANQYFLRGFNLDHGTDFSVSLDHVEMNMPTHGHGQGYADMNLLIPELIETIRFKKGPYYAEEGDFSSAGSTEIEYTNRLDNSIVKLGGGSFQYQRALIAHSQETSGNGNLLAALEVKNHDGPWERPNDSQGLNGLLKWSTGDAVRGASITLMAYDKDWDSSDQIPRRAVENGSIDRFGLIDPDLGGSTQRFSLSYSGHRADQDTLQEWYAYASQYELELYSNFTYNLENPDRGDEFQQLDDRTVAGLGYSLTQSFNSWQRPSEVKIGFQGRFDNIENGLFPSQDRVAYDVLRNDKVDQASAGLYSELTTRWTDKLKSVVGLRYDYYYADVDDQTGLNSGSENDDLVSPKFNLIYQFSDTNELYLNTGYGFHSNDARGTTIRIDPSSGEMAERVPALVRAKGADIGFRTTAIEGLNSAITAFGLELDSELVFVGDGGGTEASRPSRRTGIEWTNHYHPSERWSFDFDFTYSNARFTDDDPGGDRIPGAVKRTISSGVSYQTRGAMAYALRVRHFGGVDLIEDGSVQGEDTTTLNGQVFYRLGNRIMLSLEALNLLDSDDNDIQYFYASRLPGEPAGGIEDIHFHPVEERGIRLNLTWQY